MELYELKADNAPDDRRADLGLLGSSSASLHAKTFTTDGKRVYVGSFNFDPSSISLDTEMGFVTESANLASDIHFRFEDGILAPSLCGQAGQGRDDDLARNATRWVGCDIPPRSRYQRGRANSSDGHRVATGAMATLAA